MGTSAVQDIPKGHVRIGCGQFTRYHAVQHRYMGGEYGYIEVLEIKNPPEGRECFITYQYHERPWRVEESGWTNREDWGKTGVTVSQVFAEWASLAAARKGLDRYMTWGIRSRTDPAPLPGFIRRVVCGSKSPWFYAKGDEQVEGDFVLAQAVA